MKIEVGKTYWNRFGKAVKIIGTTDDAVYPMLGQEQGSSYTDSFTLYGVFDRTTSSNYDLVEEVIMGPAFVEPPSPPQCSQPISPLPDDSAARKEIPLWEGVLAYFPAALVAAARVSMLGNKKHNPGEPLHHARGKSMDHTDCIARHLVDYQALKAQAQRDAATGWGSCQPLAEEHLGNLAWRVLAYVQQELEEMGKAPLAPRAVIGGSK